MAETLIAKKKVLLSKIEAVYGQDPVPTAGANGIVVRSIELSPMELETQENETVKPNFGNDEEIPVLANVKLTIEVDITGSGVAGTVPPLAHYLRACCMAETILATAVTGTATAGSINGITLAAGASATDGTYVGLTINIDSGAGIGQKAVIKSYNGTTKAAVFTTPLNVAVDNTSVYTIPKQVIYRRITDNYESMTSYVYFGNKVQHKITGARGTVSFMFPYKKTPTAKFTFTGCYNPVVDAPAPSITMSGRKKPVAVNAKNTKAIKLHGYSGVIMADLSIDLGNEIVFRSLPGGADEVLITNSKPSGSITQQATTVADKDWWTAIGNVDVGAFSFIHGLEVGNTIKVDACRAQLTKPSYGESDGVVTLQTGLKLLPDLGNDELILTFL